MRRLKQMPFSGGKRPVFWDDGGVQRYISRPWYDGLTPSQRALVDAAVEREDPTHKF